MKEEIKKIVEKAIKKAGFELLESKAPIFSKIGARPSTKINFSALVSVDQPKEISHGDYSTNVALILSKKLGKPPMEVAQKIAGSIKGKMFEKVEVAPPGFINFHLSKDIFVENIKEILKSKNFGKNQNLKNQKVIVEYTDPNILKEFHIGHLMSNAIGESLSRIFEFNGGSIKRANYQGDIGLHVAKAIFGKVKNPSESWQNCYAFGSKAYEENENDKKEIEALNKKIYEKSDKNINALYEQGRKESLEKFEVLYKKLGTRFDYYFFESQIADIGKKIVNDNLGKVFEKGANGAIIFKGEKVGLHTRVFINSEGLPTYEAKDLGLVEFKYSKYKYDKSVIVTANEQNEYFKVMLSALKQIKPALSEKTKHIGHGMMRLPEGKMSSRTGKVVTAEFLIGEVEKMVAEKIKERNLSDAEKKEIIEKVAIGAVKYSILKQSIGSDIIYDFEKSISFEGDSGPYLQYSFARANSVLEKAKSEKVKPSLKNLAPINQLEKIMMHFPEIVATAAGGIPSKGGKKSGKEFEPHFIVLYLTELAREFSNYYAKNKIVDKADEFSPYKVALAQAFSIIMKNGLWLLGISAPNKM